ncbi:DUF1127 domain-containing protein [uncultured Roseobacter sp.]|uniref:DUF1127 domain-containing protein n=1 Tax=uncultured Roseobacter sp. TaxID=114847 RepID=UPI00261522F0|nr:DUF1127 domain-containing protein [uncultured Roseobacter sp.]
MTHLMTPSHRTIAYLNTAKDIPTVALLALEFAVIVSKWATRRRTRRALSQLENWQLDDVGLTPRVARTEASKVFWRV